MNEDHSSRRGQIVVDPDKPRGLPFARPLYGLPPYHYTNETVLIIAYEAREEAIREVLPRQLEPLPGNTVAMGFFCCPEVTSLGPHDFSMPCIPARYGDYVGQFVPYVYTSTEASLAAYREGQGWPAMLGETEISERRGTVEARVTRHGREVIRASAKVSARTHPIAAMKVLKTTSISSWQGVMLSLLFRGFAPAVEVLPIILYKEIPSFDGTGTDVAYFLTSTSRLTNLRFKAGATAKVAYPQRDAPISRLEPVRSIGALYGTMDDFYPESIRVLDDLKA